MPVGVRLSSAQRLAVRGNDLAVGVLQLAHAQRWTSVAPWPQRLGIVETSIDCLALTGQPKPQ